MFFKKRKKDVGLIFFVHNIILYSYNFQHCCNYKAETSTFSTSPSTVSPFTSYCQVSVIKAMLSLTYLCCCRYMMHVYQNSLSRTLFGGSFHRADQFRGNSLKHYKITLKENLQLLDISSESCGHNTPCHLHGILWCSQCLRCFLSVSDARC